MTDPESKVSTMYIRKTKNRIYIPFLFKNTCKVEKVLLDSGTSHNFLDPQTVERLKILLKNLAEPIKVLNVDGT